MIAGDDLTADGIAAAVEATRAGLEQDSDRTGPDATLEATYELRYRGQSFEIPVDAPLRPDPEALVEEFAAEHERRYGYREAGGAVELVNIRLAAREPLADFEPTADGARVPRRGTRIAHLAGTEVEVEVVAGEPPPGFALAGPCVFELPETTFLVPAGWRTEVDAAGTIVAAREPGPT